MAATFSFDIVSEIDLQEVDNSINQALKEIGQRYDFKGSRSSIEFNQKEKIITLISDDDFKMKSVLDILQGKFIKRGIPVKAIDYGTLDPAAGGLVRRILTLRVGIGKEDAKLITRLIKESKLKVQAQIMDDQVRVTGKSKDDLQQVMAMVKGADLAFAVQFTNYR